MAAELLRTLISLTLVSSVAILLAWALRRPLRAWAGVRAAYWLWLLVPVLTLASLFPLPAQVLQISSESWPAPFRTALGAVQEIASDETPSLSLALLALWLAGASAMLFAMAARQRRFTRSLAGLQPEAGGLHRSQAVIAPMLVGVWRSRILIPQDFEARYTPEERELALEHERAHQGRHDIASNLLASASLCLFWFNPLMYRALDWIRRDQELACDAQVLSRRPGAAHAYARALLKTQLATESAWRMPVGCQWQSAHPLKERVAMLKRPLPRRLRHVAGIAAIIMLATGGGYVAWAGQGAVSDKGPPILVTMKVTVSDPRTHEMFVAATQYVVYSGEVPDGMLDEKPLAFVCKPTLAADPKAPRTWTKSDVHMFLPPPGVDGSNMVMLECEIWDAGKKAFTPSVVTEVGRQAVVEYGGRFVGDTQGRRYKVEVAASTSSKDIEAAKAAAANRQ